MIKNKHKAARQIMSNYPPWYWYLMFWIIFLVKDLTNTSILAVVFLFLLIGRNALNFSDNFRSLYNNWPLTRYSQNIDIVIPIPIKERPWYTKLQANFHHTNFCKNFKNISYFVLNNSTSEINQENPVLAP